MADIRISELVVEVALRIDEFKISQLVVETATSNIFTTQCVPNVVDPILICAADVPDPL